MCTELVVFVPLFGDIFLFYASKRLQDDKDVVLEFSSPCSGIFFYLYYFSIEMLS